ncbi:unnamed protein product [Cyclocybe aegerita]|uniref:F-box domain-containing protein n=1 Tax=Cyclocybe aegerita TaxID=1973307 RepID=A0A8S0XMH3_CYCAE|nr:unnamed protein product [Cyclocybe aegerita]
MLDTECQTVPPLEVEEFLLNNSPPPDYLLPTVNDLLKASRSQLSIIQGEMDALAKLLGAVRQRFEATQQSINKYETILSPIRRVPADVLGEIFAHCLPTHRNPLFLSSEAPILPSHVCRSWRAMALSTPSLWARFHVSLPGVASELESESADTLLSGTSHTNNFLALYQQIMERRSNAVKEWLTRSGASPLSLSIFAQTTYRDFLTEITSRSAELVLDAIASCCERWKGIEFTMPLALYQKLEAKLNFRKPPCLTQIRISLDNRMHSPFAGDGAAPPPSVTLLSAPNVQGVSLSFPVTTQPFNFSSLDKHNEMAPIWDQLTRLFLHTMIPDTDVRLFLRACPRLIDCGLWAFAAADHFGTMVPTESDVPVGVISLPHLQIFKITDGGFPSTMRNTFASLFVPELRRIDYWRVHPYYDTSGSQPPPLALLEAGQSISTFHFDPQGVPKETIIQCLRTIPKLKHLIIGGRPAPHKPEIMPTNVWTPPFRTTALPLEDLVVREDAHLDDVDNDILLPSLETFEIYEPFANVSDSTLQKFICSRVGLAAARKGISSLRRVKGRFERPMQEDISGEVKQCGAEAGVDVGLELTYLTDNLETKNPFSVEFGLTQITRRTWIYSVLES